MQGKNPIRPPVKGEGHSLEVQNIFATFQGEGPRAGTPSVFIRLGGCNLACEFCDTEFESFNSYNVENVVLETLKLAKSDNGKRTRNLVVITGGEPLRQPIELLCEKLIEQGFKVQVETNGTLYRDLNEKVEIVCSPKNTGQGYKEIRSDLLERINAFKFLVSANDPKYQTIPRVGQSRFNIPVYVQPMDEFSDEKNVDNLKLAKELANNNECTLSLQTHKLAGWE